MPEIGDFSINHLSHRIKTHAIGFSMPQTLNMQHSSHFNAFFPVKINKMQIFGFLLNSPWQKMKKKHQFEQAWKFSHIGLWGMPIAMHYVINLCDNCFLSNDGFSWFLTGRFRHRVLKHGVRVEWDARRTVA